jgi:DNA repair protein RecO (recombination protein O)
VSHVATDAIVLHAFDYRETSRIFRIATRDIGVRSVMARGARNSKARFGPALDLFAEGTAQIIVHSTRDLHTLAGFDVTKARPGLAGRWSRFVAASALSEIVLRTASEESHHGLYEALAASLDALVRADDATAVSSGLAGAWRIVAELGFAPSLENCAMCGAPLDPSVSVRFAHRAGGALCAKCAHSVPGARELPPDARATIMTWIERGDASLASDPSARAHLRLLREFLHEHLGDERPLRAFSVWEKGIWLKR